eukprot:CAMPEP_0179065272 /NCGR_PEP_ID=MMETSP0796-20121207/28374_1 /TAXON_ID=73915 /ORGANISM="Pyrodinium bahamense, Strain pbaha01" /LENGTH=413 /DNA_ID=CAMNT_0020762237 /DNA_START=64 /DNA_END=1302 /DNA_ORIENTATION=-
MADDVRGRVQQLGEEIRALKASLKERGLPASAINGDAAVQALVAELRELKAQLAEGDELSDQAFFERQRKEQEERERQRKVRVEEERRCLQSMENAIEMPLVQRKIFHLFQFAGTGDSFRYEPPPRLNAEQTGFGAGEVPQPAVYLTEKWDGTTMQATSSAIFRRQEIVGKRRSKDPAHRYELKLVAWRDGGAEGRWRGLDFLEADRRVAEALTPHLERIQALDEGLCVYFECVHTHINTTFSQIKEFADIRVFDFSRVDAGGRWQGGDFLPFNETVELATHFGLPLVGWELRPRLEACEVWGELAAAVQRCYATVEAPLEGFVVREAGGPRIAKARVEHLQAKAACRATGAAAAGEPRGAGAAGAGPAPAEGPPRVGPGPFFPTRAHLEAIGLLPSGWSGAAAGHLVLTAPW